MTLILGPVFHWSPASRRIHIKRNGLKVYSKPTVTSGNLRWPYICAGFTPSGAWGLSGDFLHDRDNEDEYPGGWDLYQFNIPDGAECRFRDEFGGKVHEIKIYTSIPASGLWYVGSRDYPTAIEGGD